MVNQNIHHLPRSKFLDIYRRERERERSIFLRLKAVTLGGHCFPTDMKLYQTETMQIYEAFVDEITIICT